ncbi:acyltransferase family protein [Staphylospora marina]|uniref:acyltransferase family protein n=1 Tax=Staphylospora marina TaxID=2490858 RepID=UPI000F5B8E0D|nr:acyltransferase [Staphylospora marina]
MLRKYHLLHAARGIFSLLVVVLAAHRAGLHHWDVELIPGLDDRVRFGAMDFFFLLSGFVLFASYKSSIGDKRTARGFLIKRLIRIYSVYWYILIAIIPLSAFLTGQKASLDSIGPSVLLIPHEDSLLSSSGLLSILLVFYLFFFLFLFLGRNAGTLVAALWFLAVVIFFTQDVNLEHPVLQVLFSKYHLYFFAGAFIAHLTDKIPVKQPAWIFLIGATGTVLGVLNDLYGWVPLDDMYNYGVPVSLLLFGLAAADVKTEIRLPAWIQFMGQASYSLFLVHEPMLTLLFHLSGKDDWLGWADPLLLFALIIVAVILVGWLTHVLIEKPLLSFIFFRGNLQVSSDSYLTKRQEFFGGAERNVAGPEAKA